MERDMLSKWYYFVVCFVGSPSRHVVKMVVVLLNSTIVMLIDRADLYFLLCHSFGCHPKSNWVGG